MSQATTYEKELERLLREKNTKKMLLKLNILLFLKAVIGLLLWVSIILTLLAVTKLSLFYLLG